MMRWTNLLLLLAAGTPVAAVASGQPPEAAPNAIASPASAEDELAPPPQLCIRFEEGPDRVTTDRVIAFLTERSPGVSEAIHPSEPWVDFCADAPDVDQAQSWFLEAERAFPAPAEARVVVRPPTDQAF